MTPKATGQKEQPVIIILQAQGQCRSFLSMTGFCHIWIPNYGLKNKALSEALKGEEGNPFIERATTSDSKDCVEQSISTETSKFGQALYPIHSERSGIVL